jgi:hypothetical protein
MMKKRNQFMLLSAVLGLALGLPIPSHAQNGPPPICDVILTPPGHVPIRPFPYGCPDHVPIGVPLEPSIKCGSAAAGSLSCMGFPEEYLPDGGTGTYLTYAWEVKIGAATYNYPQSYSNLIEFNCSPERPVSIILTLSNDNADSWAKTTLICPAQ